MKTLSTIIIAFFLITCFNISQAQIGKIKSVGSSVINEKPDKSTTKPADKPAKESNQPASTDSKTGTVEKKDANDAKTKEVVLGKYSDIKPAMTDATLEKQGLELVNEKAARERWKEKYTVAKIISKDWVIVKNELTGAILHRKIYMSLYGVWPDGKCKAVEFGFLQDWEGSKYSGTLQYNSIGGMKQVECE